MANDIISEAVLKTGSSGIDSKTFPRWSVHKEGTNQTNVGTAQKLITWHGAKYDEGANVNLVYPFQFTVPAGAAGIYDIGACLYFSGNTDNQRIEAYIYVDGVSSKVHSIQTSASDSSVSVQAHLKLAVGQTVAIWGRNVNTARTIPSNITLTYFYGCRIA